MMEPRPSVVRFVAAVMRIELASGGERSDASAAQRIMVRLHQQLGKLIGSAGLDVMLARAIVLARRAHPSLGDVKAGPSGTLAGLDDGSFEAAALQSGGAAIVAHFLELLAVLIGEDLAMRLVSDVWPAVAATEEEKK